MIETILNTVLSTGLLLVSSTSPSSAPPYTFTKVLPQENYVTYAVQKSQTLRSIARDFYKDASYWTVLAQDNAEAAKISLPEGYLLKVRVEVDAKQKTAKKPEKTVAIQPTSMPTVTAIPVARSYAPASSYDDVYRQAGEKYGIPWQILYGLHITESGGRNGPIASGRGPQGPMQFMPGTWRAYAVDGDGDGVADINNAYDAIHGAANYLAKHGSLDAGLRAYGGNTTRTLALARERGYTE